MTRVIQLCLVMAVAALAFGRPASADDELGVEAFEECLRLALRYRARATLAAQSTTTKEGILAAFALAHCLDENGEPYLTRGSTLDEFAGFPARPVTSAPARSATPPAELWPKIYLQLNAAPPKNPSYFDYLLGLQLVALQRLWSMTPPPVCADGAGSCPAPCSTCLSRCREVLKGEFQLESTAAQRILYTNNDLSVLQFRALGFHMAQRMGLEPKTPPWSKFHEYLNEPTYKTDSGYRYDASNRTSAAMTAAGLTVLTLAAQHETGRVGCGHGPLTQVTGAKFVGLADVPSYDRHFKTALTWLVNDIWRHAGTSDKVDWLAYTLFALERLMLHLGLEEVPVEGREDRAWHAWGVRVLHRRLAESLARNFAGSVPIATWNSGRSLGSLTPADIAGYLEATRPGAEAWKRIWCGALENDQYDYVDPFISLFLEKASPAQPRVQQLVHGAAEHFHGLIPQHLGLPGRFLPVDRSRTRDLLGQMRQSPVVLVSERKLVGALRMPELPDALFDYLDGGGALVVEDLSGELRSTVAEWIKHWRTRDPLLGDLRAVAAGHPLHTALVGAKPDWDATLKALGRSPAKPLHIEALSFGGCHDSLYVLTGSTTCPLTPHCAGAMAAATGDEAEGLRAAAPAASRTLWTQLEGEALGMARGWPAWRAKSAPGALPGAPATPPAAPAVPTPGPPAAPPAAGVRIQGRLLGHGVTAVTAWPPRRLPRSLVDDVVTTSRALGVDLKLDPWQRSDLPEPRECQLLLLALEPGAQPLGVTAALKSALELGQRLVVLVHPRSGEDPNKDLRYAAKTFADDLGLTQVPPEQEDGKASTARVVHLLRPDGRASVVLVELGAACGSQAMARKACPGPSASWVEAIYQEPR